MRTTFSATLPRRARGAYVCMTTSGTLKTLSYLHPQLQTASESSPKSVATKIFLFSHMMFLVFRRGPAADAVLGSLRLQQAADQRPLGLSAGLARVRAVQCAQSA